MKVGDLWMTGDVVGGGGGRHAESRSEDLFNKTEIHETSQVRVASALDLSTKV